MVLREYTIISHRQIGNFMAVKHAKYVNGLFM